MAKEPKQGPKQDSETDSILDSYVDPVLPGTARGYDDGRTWRQGPWGSGLQPANGELAGKLDGIVPKKDGKE